MRISTSILKWTCGQRITGIMSAEYQVDEANFVYDLFPLRHTVSVRISHVFSITVGEP